MITYIIRRVLYTIPVLFASMFLSFAFVSYAGDPLSQLRQIPRVSQAAIAIKVKEYQLDQPVPIRFFHWLWTAITHDFGRSLVTTQQIGPRMFATFGVTAQFVLIAEAIAIIIGCSVGVYSAIRQYSFFDYSFTTLSFLGFALPTFWLAILLQQLFVLQYNGAFGILKGVRIFYTAEANSVPGGPTWSVDRFQHLALPIVTLATISFALYSRYMRASMLDVINSDYVRTARAKGLPEWRVILRHVVPNAMIPIVTVLALNLAGILGGAIITETVFSLDGIGKWFLDSLNRGDQYAVMAYLAFTGVIIVVFNLVADILYGVLDPRIRYE
jgi:peptide/nickel transport system permease protein